MTIDSVQHHAPACRHQAGLGANRPCWAQQLEAEPGGCFRAASEQGVGRAHLPAAARVAGQGRGRRCGVRRAGTAMQSGRLAVKPGERRLIRTPPSTGNQLPQQLSPKRAMRTPPNPPAVPVRRHHHQPPTCTHPHVCALSCAAVRKPAGRQKCKSTTGCAGRQMRPSRGLGAHLLGAGGDCIKAGEGEVHVGGAAEHAARPVRGERAQVGWLGAGQADHDDEDQHRQVHRRYHCAVGPTGVFIGPGRVHQHNVRSCGFAGDLRRASQPPCTSEARP